jgi:hypothetical protein
MKKESARCVVQNLQQINIQKQKPVPENVQIKCVGVKSIKKVNPEPVYNMEVEDNHNFAVNDGLIVHNCMDACRYFVKTVKIVKPKSNYKSMYE